MTDTRAGGPASTDVLMERGEDGSPVRLRASRCDDCGRWEFPARDYCPACEGSTSVAALAPVARVVRVTAVLHAPPGSLVEAPYVVVMAAFPEGLSIFGVVLGAAVGEVSSGQEVETVTMQVGGLWAFAYRLV